MNISQETIEDPAKLAIALNNIKEDLYQSYIFFHGDFGFDPMNYVGDIDKKHEDMGYLAILWKIVKTYGVDKCIKNLNLYIDYYNKLLEVHKKRLQPPPPPPPSPPPPPQPLPSPLPPPPPKSAQLWADIITEEANLNKKIHHINIQRVGSGTQLVPLFYGPSFWRAMSTMFTSHPQESGEPTPPKLIYDIDTFDFRNSGNLSWNPETFCTGRSMFFLNKSAAVPVLKKLGITVANTINRPTVFKRLDEFEEFYLKPLKAMWPKYSEVIRKTFADEDIANVIPIVHTSTQIWNIVKEFVDFFILEEGIKNKLPTANIKNIRSYHVNPMKRHQLKDNIDKYKEVLRDQCKIRECPFTGAIYIFKDGGQDKRGKQEVEDVKPSAQATLLPQFFF